MRLKRSMTLPQRSLRRSCEVTNKLVIGVTLLSLIALGGCGSERIQYVYVRQQVPEILLEQTTVPLWAGRTNKDFADYTQQLRYSLDACNADKQAIKAVVADE
jgi:hypothetical protein